MMSPLARLLETESQDASEPIIARFVRVVAEDLGAEVAAYSPVYANDRYLAEQFVHSGQRRMESFEKLLKAYLPSAPLCFGHFDPLRVSVDQQNTVLDQERCRNIIANDTPDAVRATYAPLGLTELSHMRVLFAGGSKVLAWFGVWREERFSRKEEKALSSVIPRVVQRLVEERQRALGTSALGLESLAAAIDLINEPVFLVDSTGRLDLVNLAGRALIEVDRSIVGLCADAAFGRRTSPRIRSVRVLGKHSLVVVDDAQAAVALRITEVASDTGLTGAETKVLGLLIRGGSNKEIASTMGSATRTVEVHVTSILKKCKKESRARLIAWFWSER